MWKKKLLAFILVILILCFSTINAFASSPDYSEGDPIMLTDVNGVDWHASDIAKFAGATVTAVKSVMLIDGGLAALTEAIAAGGSIGGPIGAIVGGVSGCIVAGTIYFNSYGDMVAEEEAAKELSTIVRKNQSDNSSYYWYSLPMISYTDNWFGTDDIFGFFYETSSWYEYVFVPKSRLATLPLCVVGSSVFYFGSTSIGALGWRNTSILKSSGSKSGYTYDYISGNMVFYGRTNLSCFGKGTLAFKDMASYNYYLQNYYSSSSSLPVYYDNSYVPSSYSVPAAALNNDNNDFIQIVNDNYDTVVNDKNNYITTNNTINDDIYNDIINNVIENTIYDTTVPEPDPAEEEVTDDLTQTNNWLKRIYLLIRDLDFTKKFDDLIAAIKDIKVEVDDGTSFWDMLRDIISNTLGTLGGSILKDIYDFFIGEGDGIVDTITDSAGSLASEASTRFPTSIPWDIIAIISIFEADPVAPEFVLPFTIQSADINESLTLEFSTFDTIVEMVRGFEVVMFIMYLLILTRKMYISANAE